MVMNSEDPTRGHACGNNPLPAAAAALRDVNNNVGPHQSSHQPHQRQKQHQSSSFLEPFPTAAQSNSKCHFHDAFGESDSGVDYGPPTDNDYEDGNDVEGGDEAEERIDEQTNLLNGLMVDEVGGEVVDEETIEQNNAGVSDSGEAVMMAGQPKMTESINLDATSASAEQRRHHSR